MATKVKLDKHYLKNGTTTLHIAYYPPFYDKRTRRTIKSENLNLFLYTHPKTKVEKDHNEDIDQLAKAILSKRIVSVHNQEYGFLDKSVKKEDFIEYFRTVSNGRHSKWDGALKQFIKFTGGKCTFGMVTVDFCKRYREFLLHDAINVRTGARLTQNSASGYFATFRSLLKRAYVDKLLESNLNDFFDGIPMKKTKIPYLTIDEIHKLMSTPCMYDVLRRIAIFGLYTGLRISDLESLTWENIVRAPDGSWCIRKEIRKSAREETIPVTEEALYWCGERSSGKVFTGFTRTMISGPFHKWIEDAGITDKHITFHCLRHTTATTMCSKGVDVYLVSKMLTHSNVQTTQIYAEVSDGNNRMAAERMSEVMHNALCIPDDTQSKENQ